MSHPVPAVVHAAETSAEILMNSPVILEEVMWATRRRMFTIRFPVTPDKDALTRGIVPEVVRGHIVAKAPEGYSPRALEVDGHESEQSLRDLLLWTTSSLIDYYPPHARWSPAGDYINDSGHLYFLTTEGLYYDVGSTARAWFALAKCGVLDSREWVPGRTNHYIRHVPAIELGGYTIGGGQYLVVHHQRATTTIPSDQAIQYHHLIAIEDGEGSLAGAWAQAAKGGETGPLLLPGDKHSAMSSDWWTMGPGDWLFDGPFDAWHELVDKKFMRTPFSADDFRRRERREELLVLEILEDHDSAEPTRYWVGGMTTHPAFRAHRITQLLLEHDRDHGSWKVAEEPIHSWAKELSDNPVLQRAVDHHRLWWSRYGNRSGPIKLRRQ